jgi:hypothetical protein
VNLKFAIMLVLFLLPVSVRVVPVMEVRSVLLSVSVRVVPVMEVRSVVCQCTWSTSNGGLFCCLSVYV